MAGPPITKRPIAAAFDASGVLVTLLHQPFGTIMLALIGIGIVGYALYYIFEAVADLRGNVLEFKWQEPNDPPLTGSGYLVFDRSGRQYSGRWWSDRRDRVGDWNGWRNAPGGEQYRPSPSQDPYADPSSDAYGGPTYGEPGPSRDPYGPRPPQPQRRPAPQPQPGTYGPQPPPPHGSLSKKNVVSA